MSSDFEPFDLYLDDVAKLMGKTLGALYKQIARGKGGDLPIYNVGTEGKGRRYRSRTKEIRAWLDSRRGGGK